MASTNRAAAKKRPTRPAAKNATASRTAAPRARKAPAAAKTTKPAPGAAVSPAKAKFEAPAKAKFEAPAKAKFESPAKAKFESPAKAKFESPASSTAAAKDKPAKAKLRVALVRDGFTMPETDFALIAVLKARALAGHREAKKSELLRAGLQALAALDGPALVQALNRLEPIKTGRPKKNH